MATKEAMEWAARIWCRPENGQREMDSDFAISIAEEFDIATAHNREVMDNAEDALQWASGSSDFNVGGVARRGWLKLGRPALSGLKARARIESDIAEVHESPSGRPSAKYKVRLTDVPNETVEAEWFKWERDCVTFRNDVGVVARFNSNYVIHVVLLDKSEGA